MPRQRGETVYGVWSVTDLCAAFARETPRVGLWIETSDLSPGETVALALANFDRAQCVRVAPKPGDVQASSSRQIPLLTFKSGGQAIVEVRYTVT